MYLKSPVYFLDSISHNHLNKATTTTTKLRCCRMKTAHVEGWLERSDPDDSVRLLLRCCFPIYPTTSIMTSLSREMKARNFRGVVCTPLWADVRGIYSGLASPPSLSRSTAVNALKKQHQTPGAMTTEEWILACCYTWVFIFIHHSGH